MFLETVDGGVFLFFEEQKWKAGMLHAGNVIDKNFSFQSYVSDNYLYPEVFSDSEIARHYQTSSTKVMHIMEVLYGIAKYFKDGLTKEVQEKLFTFHLDEFGTSQTKKQYGGYVKFFSLESREVVIAYCRTFFIGRFSAPDMVNHLKTFVSKQNLDVKLLLSLGMDSPNVNLAFQNLLIKELNEKYHTSLIDLGTCSLHSENNGFGKLVKEIDDIVEIDHMAIDFLFFFKYSAGRKEDFTKYQK